MDLTYSLIFHPPETSSMAQHYCWKVWVNWMA